MHLDSQSFRNHLLKRLSLLPCVVLALLSKMSWLYFRGSISSLSFQFSDLFPTLLPIPHCLDDCTVIVSQEAGQHHSPNFAFLLQYIVSYSGSFASTYCIFISNNPPSFMKKFYYDSQKMRA